MATTTSITTTYAGEKMREYLSLALFEGNTISNGGLTVKPNVKYKEVIKTLAVGDLIAAGTCDFTDTSSVTVGENYLTPKELQVNLELCKSDFRSDFDALEMGVSAHDNLPSTFQDYITSLIVAKVADSMEKQIWHGNDSANQINGLVNRATADVNVIDVTGGALGFTIDASNVIAELEKVYNAIPAELFGESDLRIFVSQSVFKAYSVALGGFAANGLGANGYDNKGTNQAFSGLMFAGVPLFLANGLQTDYMFAARTSNLFMGTGLTSDWNELKILDMADLDGSQNVRFIMRFTADVNYVFGEEVVLYTPVV
jgi:small basic protein